MDEGSIALVALCLIALGQAPRTEIAMAREVLDLAKARFREEQAAVEAERERRAKEPDDGDYDAHLKSPG